MNDPDFSTDDMLPIERDDTDGPDEPPLSRRPWPRLHGDDGDGGDGGDGEED